MHPSLPICLTALVAAASAARVPAHIHHARQNMTNMDESPNYPHDPNTAASCRWWWDNDGSISCQNMPAEWGISMADFLAWNPSITASCGNYNVGQSYCVEADPPSTGTTTTSAPPTTTTPPGNGVATPTPHQTLVDNCNKFHFVEKGQTCAVIAPMYGISQAQMITWNPDVGSDCTGMWAEAYVCVGIIGQTSSTTSKPTTTSAGNGITTPTPTQAQIVSNCNKFYYVNKGETCATIASKNGVTSANVIAWNPSVGSDCLGLWADAYACVGVIGGTPTTTTTKTTTTGNGIATPTPTQAQLVSNCNKFYWVNSGETCTTVASKNGITVANVIAWNPSVGSDCKGLWANAYACIGVK